MQSTTQNNTNTKTSISKQERKRRAQQSAKDKAVSLAKSAPISTGMGQVNKATRLVNPLAASALKHELDLDQSIAHDMQTLFNPRAGAHRPYSEGYEETALVTWESSFNISGFTNVNNAVTICAVPGGIAAIDQISWAFCPGGALVNPVTDPQGLPSPGPFYAAQPGNSARVVAFEMTLTPIGPRMNLAGSGALAYVAKGALLDSFRWDRAAGYLEKQKYSKTFAGSDKLIAHWLPNSVEESLLTVVNAPVAGSQASSLCLYYVAPTGVAADEQFRVDIIQTIEYVPNQSYYPYVSLLSSMALPTTKHYVTMSFMGASDPLVVGTYDDWRKLVDAWTVISGHTHSARHAVLGNVYRAEAGADEVFDIRGIPDARAVRPGHDGREDDLEEQKIEEVGLDTSSLIRGGVTTAINVGNAIGGNPIGLINQVAGLLGSGETVERRYAAPTDLIRTDLRTASFDPSHYRREAGVASYDEI